MAWKIYTKTGDKGETSLIGGTRVQKYDDQVEAYGSIDELNSHLGLIRDMCENENMKEWLLIIQERLFVIASLVASDSEKSREKMPQLSSSDIVFLEQSIDEMNNQLPDLTQFILPGGHVLASQAHIARTVCRRAERWSLKASKKELLQNLVIPYLNRLSDFLFVLARYFANELGKGDIVWNPKNK